MKNDKSITSLKNVTFNSAAMHLKVITLEKRLVGNRDSVSNKLYQQLEYAVKVYAKASKLYLWHVTDIGDAIDELNRYLDDADAYNNGVEMKRLRDERIMNAVREQFIPTMLCHPCLGHGHFRDGTECRHCEGTGSINI